MIRDKIKSKEYFEGYISEIKSVVDKSHQNYANGIIKDDRVFWYKLNVFGYNFDVLIAKYSLGFNLAKIKTDYLKTLEMLSVGWLEQITKVKGGAENTELWDQYMVSPHAKMLQMLSLGYLLNISDQDFKVLVDIIDRDNISDNLYEFIIKARFPDREQKRPEEYDPEHSVILKVYDKLRKATEQTDKAEANTLVKQFLEKNFYHKNSNFYEFHKKKYNAYYGYWSFEVAAVVKIMGLDDSSFIDQQYYPKDLVHQYPEPPKKKGLLGKLGF